MGYCHFCQQEKKLIKAHVLPRKFYIKDKNEPYQGVKKDGSYKIWQCGFYDENILCGDCDNNKLKQYEDEAYKLLLNIDTKKSKTFYNNIPTYHYKAGEFDYNKIRKFFIALIWKASISKTGFNGVVDLGIYEEIALKILKDEIQNDNLFKIIVLKESAPNEFTNVHYIMKTRYDKQITYAVYFAEYVAYIIPSYKKSQMKSLDIFDKLFITSTDFIIAESSAVSSIKKNYLLKNFASGIKNKASKQKIKK